MAKLSLNSRIGHAVKSFALLVSREKPVKADLNLAGLNTLIQNSADEELTILIAETQEKLRSGLTAVVAKTAPGAVPEVQDDVEVMIYVIMQDRALRAKLNAAARKAGIKDAIAYLRAALTQAENE